MESVDLVQTSGTSSPPRRDSMEDADSTLTRKRPRLDSGSRATRSMSADVMANGDQAENATVEPVEVTINVRSQPASSEADNSKKPPTGPPEPVLNNHVIPEQAGIVDQAQLAGMEAGMNDLSADSPPVIEVALDDDSDEGMEEYMGHGVIQIDDMDPEEILATFPYSTRSNVQGAIKLIVEHFQGSNGIDGPVLPTLANWLNQYPDQPSYFKRFYIDQPIFWDDLATIFTRILQRRYPFGEEFCSSGETEEHIIYQFLQSYVMICARLIQIDSEELKEFPDEAPVDHHLLCLKHLKALNAILRSDGAPLFRLLAKDYLADVRIIGTNLAQDFLRPSMYGLRHLASFAELAWVKVQGTTKNHIAMQIVQILECLGWSILDLSNSDASIDRTKFSKTALQVFRTYDKDLQVPGKILDVTFNRDIVLSCAKLLHCLASIHEQTGHQLADAFLEPQNLGSSSGTDEETGPMASLYDPAHLPALVSHAWKFKLLKKYILKGRMELRVLCIGTMDSELVEIWKEYNTSDLGTNHPVMQYLAEFLLNEKVIEYIIGVDSHPQLIQRSGNVVGFLVVTHRYTERQTDAIWETVATSPDPRVVSATMIMLKNIVNLMEPPELLYICAKLYELPIESYTLEILRFCREVSSRAQSRNRDWTTVVPKSWPSWLCVRMVQDTAPSRTSTKLSNSLHAEASDQLRTLGPNVTFYERERIYESCVHDIANMTDKATGSAHAIWVLWYNTTHDNTKFLTERLDLARHLILELCSFVRTEKELGPHPYQVTAMQYRLDLLGYIIVCSPQSLPVELYDTLWDHIVGKDALSNSMRDHAWSRLTDAAKAKYQCGQIVRNVFCSRIASDHIPKLEPIYFTTGLYEFIFHITLPLEKKKGPSGTGNGEILEIPGANLLWPLVLAAPTGTVEDLAARLLAGRYLDIFHCPDVTYEEIEDAHIALAEQCTKRLLTSYGVLRSGNVESVGESDSMAVVASDVELRNHELGFTRTLLFEKMFLNSIRPRTEFNRPRRTDSKCDPLEPEVIRGESIEIKFQAFGGTTTERQSIQIGKQNTFRELHERLCRLTGFSKLTLIVGGKKLAFDDWADTEIGKIEAITWVLVSKAPGAEPLQEERDPNANCSSFETSVLKHFEELYSCMDSEDHISEAIFDLLCLFKPRERIAEVVASGSASASDIFPPGKVFQAKYAALALQNKLRTQLNKGIVDEKFLSNTIRLLDSALLDSNLISASLTGKHDVPLASILVGVLLGFLKERPLQDLSAQYFSNEALLVERVLSFLYKSLETENEDPSVTCNCYATILEASLHSRKVWEAFVSRQDILSLHQRLLLVDRRLALRHSVVQSIASVCGGDLPSTSPLSGIELAAFYWKVISSILPETVRYCNQSAQLFTIAEQVFRRNDESDRDENSLRGFLTSWSRLLLNYRHEEFVGRDDVDIVVFGFTKLLLCCIQSLKSFKKPLNVGRLMEEVFRKFLFPLYTEITPEDSSEDSIELPVLESATRKELYDLILALAEDRSSYDMLLDLTFGLVDDEESMSAKSYSIDRSNEIRSSTGYVGLANPRAICYMNSLLTQLFMNLNFRKFVLEVKVADAGGSQRLLSDTQKLFAIMQNTFRKAADPREFAACVKGLNSEPIDINVQMDADEFYNLLFDQWEGQMLSSETKQLFRSFYGGQTVNQIKSKECEHVSEREEGFFVIQCDVQGKATLQESLQSFVEGDVMEGDNKYKCESCGGRFVNAVKRTCLKDVPDNLIFHLKRFDFDLVDMRRQKINDHFEFPSQIDVSPYNVDHLSDPDKPRQEDMFELVGVLVHQGNSENGHYYSFIRERPSASGSSATWLEFNDRDVTEFDPGQISHQAFGGFFEDQFQRQQKQFSAYMLFYQRRSAMDADHVKYISSPYSGPPKVPVPAELGAQIAVDNESFIRDYCLYDPNHSRFIRQMLSSLRTVNNGVCSEDHRQERLALAIALEHVNQVMSRLRDIANFDEIMIQLKKTVSACAKCCKMALDWMCQREYPLAGLLLRCPHLKVRSQIRTFLMECLMSLREKDPVLYGIDVFDPEPENGLVADDNAALATAAARLRQVGEHTTLGTRGWEDYYLTLCQLANTGIHETAALLRNEVLKFCLEVLCMHTDPSIRLHHLNLWRLVEKKKSIYNRMIELVWCILSKIDLNMEPVLDENYRLEMFDRSSSKFPLTIAEKNLLILWNPDDKAYVALGRMIECFDVAKSEIFYPGEIVKLLLNSNDVKFLRGLHMTIFEGVSSLQPPYAEPYVRAAISYCEACPTANDAFTIIRSVSKSTESLTNQAGETYLTFFHSLVSLRNERIELEKYPEWFYDQVMCYSRQWGMALLMFEDENIRKNAATLLEFIFLRMTPLIMSTERATKWKYECMRGATKDFMNRIKLEHDNGLVRSYMQPMIGTTVHLIHAIAAIAQSDDPQLEPFKSLNDAALIRSYQQMETRIRNWVVDDDTILSGGEAYDDSQYATDSDDAIEVET